MWLCNRKRPTARLSGAALLAFAASLACAQAQAQTAPLSPDAQTSDPDSSVLELVRECDTLAAHPNDPQRMNEGVADDKIVPRLAIRACEQAIKEDKTDPRFTFQLGRALLAAGKKAEATAQFRKSAEAGHAAAWAYVGDALQFGHGEPIDYGKARDAYTKARDGGFDRATELVDQLNFLPGLYAVGVLAQLYSRDHTGIASIAQDSERKWLTRAYMFSLVQKLMTECDDALTSKRVIALYTFRYGSGWSGETDAQTAVGIYSAVGEHDARVFMKRHGCDGVIAKHVFQSIDSFLSEFKDP